MDGHCPFSVRLRGTRARRDGSALPGHSALRAHQVVRFSREGGWVWPKTPPQTGAQLRAGGTLLMAIFVAIERTDGSWSHLRIMNNQCVL